METYYTLSMIQHYMILLFKFFQLWPLRTIPIDPKHLDSILKSRNITLQAKVHLVKAIVFPVVMYGYENWTIKKAEH